VGLALSLDGEFDVSKVIVDTEQAGWGASIFVSAKDASLLTTLTDWGPVRAQGTDLAPAHTFALDGSSGVKGRSILLWLTQLPAGDGGKHSVRVAEVTLA
jgi:hypothetical protein